MLHVVLFQPEIPPNTGAALHLVRPLGFELDHAKLRRAGLDYHEFTRVAVHDDLAAFMAAAVPRRLFALSTRGSVRYDTVTYADGDALLFGPETRGLPQDVLDAIEPAQRLHLPMQPGNRSVNLSNTVAVVVYEAWRQLGFGGAGARG